MKQQKCIDTKELNAFTLYYGGNGHGKSRKIRELNEFSNVYNVNYENGYSFEIYEDAIKEVAELLWGEPINYDHQLSTSQMLIVNIAKEYVLIRDLTPGVVTFDSLPATLDSFRMSNLFSLFKLLANLGHKVIFATATETYKSRFLEFFKNEDMTVVNFD